MSTYPFNILYRDEHLIAMEKPHGLLVHRSPIDKRETQFAVQMLRDQIGQHVHPIHRLDRPTSGVLMFALDNETASLMGKSLMEFGIKKRYLAIVRGWVHQDGMIDYALTFKHDKFADADRVAQVPPQPALSSYSPKERFHLPYPVGRYESARFSLLEMSPHSGRKHQLRRHCAHIRHPIIGDTTHGDGKQNKFLRERFDFHNLALTCTEMGFFHPYSNQWTKITCGMSENTQQLLDHWQQFKV